MKLLFTAFFAVISITLFAQKTEQIFDYHFRPTKTGGRFYVTTENKDGRWYREGYYMPEGSMAMKGWYNDEACKIPDGEIIWFHENRSVKSINHYSNGKLNGIQYKFHDNNNMQDSSNYVNGHLTGSLGWDQEGYQIDSISFDGKGNGVSVHWYANGPVYSTGFFQDDTMRVKRWTYYHRNGKIMATQNYTDGKTNDCKCYNENGEALNISSKDCEGVEASFPGDEGAWRAWLAKTLDPNVPVRNKAPIGLFTVLVRFVVDTDGKIKEIKALTNYGFGMEKEAIRVLNKAPKWIPANQFGKNVKAYRIQPISFSVSD